MGRNAFDDSWMTRPLANVVEGDEEYRIEFTMPGFKREEIDINIKDDILRVQAVNDEPDKHKYLHKEVPRRLGERVFEIPGHIDQDKIHAKLDQGILTIYMPFKVGVPHVAKHVEVE
jgi:HSP20 family protein